MILLGRRKLLSGRPTTSTAIAGPFATPSSSRLRSTKSIRKAKASTQSQIATVRIVSVMATWLYTLWRGMSLSLKGSTSGENTGLATGNVHIGSAMYAAVQLVLILDR